MNIGIDLGTTFSCVSVYIDGKATIIPNTYGENTTRSIVSLQDNEIIVGKICSDKYVFDSKRMLGKQFNNTHIQSYYKHWPFSIREHNEQIIIYDKYTPIDISGFILKYMKEIAQQYSKKDIINAVITVPAYFNDKQRSDTLKAGNLAGINIKRLINEPTAAAIAYGLDKLSGDKNIIVFDLGGGTFDISILNICDGVFEVIATGGDCNLGGQDINNNLVLYCLKEFRKKNKTINITKLLSDKKILFKLNNACELAKKSLSYTNTTNIYVDSLYEGIDLSVTLSRSKFEYICSTFFQKCIKVVDNVLNDSNLSKNDIDHVVLIGGSTRIPAISDLLEKYFGKKPKNNINPDEAVAYGAAIYSASIAGDNNLTSLVLVDVTPLSLGIEAHGGIMENIIKRNTPIPCTKTKMFTTFSDNQPSISVNIYEGERKQVKCNNLLGSFTLSGIPPMLRGVPKINILFRIDHNGILNISASEESSSIKQCITIHTNKCGKSEKYMQDMIIDAEQNKKKDKMFKHSTNLHKCLINTINNAKSMLDDEMTKEKIPEDIIIDINTTIINITAWTNNDNISQAYPDEYNTKIKEMESIIYKICMLNN